MNDEDQHRELRTGGEVCYLRLSCYTDGQELVLQSTDAVDHQLRLGVCTGCLQ